MRGARDRNHCQFLGNNESSLPGACDTAQSHQSNGCCYSCQYSNLRNCRGQFLEKSIRDRSGTLSLAGSCERNRLQEGGYSLILLIDRRKKLAGGDESDTRTSDDPHASQGPRSCLTGTRRFHRAVDLCCNESDRAVQDYASKGGTVQRWRCNRPGCSGDARSGRKTTGRSVEQRVAVACVA